MHTLSNTTLFDWFVNKFAMEKCCIDMFEDALHGISYARVL